MAADERKQGGAELGACDWRVSSLCGNNGCVAVRIGSEVAVRDGKQSGGAELAFTVEEWRAFVAGVKNGEFDA